MTQHKVTDIEVLLDVIACHKQADTTSYLTAYDYHGRMTISTPITPEIAQDPVIICELAASSFAMFSYTKHTVSKLRVYNHTPKGWEGIIRDIHQR